MNLNLHPDCQKKTKTKKNNYPVLKSSGSICLLFINKISKYLKYFIFSLNVTIIALINFIFGAFVMLTLCVFAAEKVE